MRRLILTLILLTFGVNAWATDRTPSIRTSSYVCGCDGGWLTGCYCSDMVDIVEQYIGWSDGCLTCTDPDWSDTVRAHGSAMMYNYATIKGAWCARYADTANYVVGRFLFYPATMLYNICTRRWPDSAANMYERLYEHYEDSVVFVDGANYVLCPPADEDADGLIEAVDSCARIIYYMSAYGYGSEDVDYRGTTCKKATGKGRCLYAMNEPWQREVLAEYFQFACTTTSTTFYCDGGPPYSIYLDNADIGNSQVRGINLDQLGSVAVSYEAPADSNAPNIGDTGAWTTWKHRNMMITLQVIRDSVQSVGQRLAVNVVYGTALTNYYNVDTGNGNLFDPVGIQLNEERMGGWSWLIGNNDWVPSRCIESRVAEIETCTVKGIPVNWDSWTLDQEGTASTTPSVPTGFTDLEQYMNYNSMCAYYLAKPQAAGDDSLFWISFNSTSCGACSGGDWAGHWCDAMSINVGAPDSVMYLAYAGPCDGVDRGVSPDTTRVYRRDFDSKGYIVLYHPGWSWSTSSNNVLGDSVYVTYNPSDVDSVWFLKGDSTWSAATVSYNLPIGCGAILATSNPGVAGSSPGEFEIGVSTGVSFGKVDYEEDIAIPVCLRGIDW